jgi:hypothetical protein
MYFQISSIRNSAQTYNSPVLTELKRFKPLTQWLYTDEPIYSFHAGIPIPPDLAVVMLKRFWSGEMTNARLTDELREYKPGLVLVHNDTRVYPFQEFLNTDYRLVYIDAAHRLYAHKSIADKAVY